MSTTRCNCKICRENLTDFVNDLYQKGVSKDTILSTLKNNHGISTNKSALTRHLEKYQIDDTKRETVQEPIRETIVNNFISVDLNSLSFSRYDFDENSPESIINYIQKVHLALYLKQLEIVARQINQYYLGEADVEPTQSIVNLKRLFELLDKTTGIEMTVSQQRAIQTVESMGYNLTTKLLEFN